MAFDVTSLETPIAASEMSRTVTNVIPIPVTTAQGASLGLSESPLTAWGIENIE